MAVFPGVGNAVEILAGRQIRGQKRRVLIPRRVFEVVLCPRWPVHCRCLFGGVVLCECVLFRFFVPSQDRVSVYILYYLPADFGISETGPVAIRDSSSSKEFACMTRQQRVKFWKLPVPWGAGVTLDPCSAPVRLVSWALIRRGARGQACPCSGARQHGEQFGNSRNLRHSVLE